MAKNLVFFADGTGNDRAQGRKTNVAKLSDRAENMRVAAGGPTWQHLSGPALDGELAHPGVRQITHYDEGVGTEFGDLVGKATGSGISRNIQDGYDFLVRFHEPGDRVFLFGFSRGAYTVRSLAGLVGLCGVAKRFQGDGGTDLRHDAGARRKIVAGAYAVYKTGSGQKEAGREARSAAAERFRRAHAHPEHEDPAARAPYLIGVWDTVRSLGIPLGYKDWELSLWPHRFHDHDLNPCVRYAFHALSIDDRRQQFLPTLWNEPTRAQEIGDPVGQVFEQVWFPGVHADVGGGYEDSGLSDVALGWMIDKAVSAGHPLLFSGDPRSGLDPRPTARLHDSRDRFWKKLVYREAPRSICKGHQEPLSKATTKTGEAFLHGSWRDRIGELFSSYDSPHLGGHPDYLRVLDQLGRGVRPPSGPWSHIR
ncbi:MAG: hypothetical protein AVDCRST_MAG08-3779 [uncultured Acetobacteraceae bacterium]|uniref:T6SS Phospholipase effector Tle1-like catalytic domain-containing protein n=1 Tax=uncultured Acetobacteraceae bacterium TaxID=169975 RepID=A0A6J4JKX5_9PROT|nr:MAG: hypothetical protein AVDCRST_MAG08-3779 [uncultured Acetobacteraceae bacterium]